MSFFNKLASIIPEKDFLYIGNSLPVRQWDLVDHKPRSFFANRGVNGIDGQISSALGAMKKNSKNWIVLGDLTTLYDFSALWVTPYLKENNIHVNLIVINNGGGQIFSRIFESPLFRNSHQLNFEHFAKMWGWDYLPVTSEESLDIAKDGLKLIEVLPEVEASQKFWSAFDRLWT